MGKIEPWRLIVGIIAVGYIIFMWSKKDIFAIYSAMPQEQALPLVITTVAVSLIKIAALAGGIFLVRWIVRKIKDK